MLSVRELRPRRYPSMEERLEPASAPGRLVPLLLEALEAPGYGTLVLDAEKRILHLTAHARDAFGSHFGVRDGKLYALDRSCDLLLQALLDEHLSDRGGTAQRRPALALKHGDRGPLVLRVVRIEPAARHEAGGAALVLVLLDPQERREPSMDLLQQAFGLTRAEARLAVHLICGETLQEIAARTRVAVGTLRSQTKALFAKTGTHRQAQLVALLTRLAMMSGER